MDNRAIIDLYTSEKEFQKLVIGLAKTNHWLCADGSRLPLP